jgi:hypothetical protein
MVKLRAIWTGVSLLLVACTTPAAPPGPTAVPATPTAAPGPGVAPPPVAAVAPPQPAPAEAPSPTGPPAAKPAATRSAAAPAPTPAATKPAPSPAEAPRALEPKWYVDGDGNFIPDFLEQELGYDATRNDCASEQCGDGGAGADLLTRERNTLLILDASGSMAGPAGGGETKIAAAKASLGRYIKMTPDLVRLGFMVYGHRGSNSESSKGESCAGIDLLAPIGQVPRDQLGHLLDQFEATGWTPIAGALTRASEAFHGKEGAVNRIILISDGVETCDGDPVAVARHLHGRDLAVQIDVVGFDIESSAEAQQLGRIAEVTGGTYRDARTRADLDAYFNEQGKVLAQMFDAMTCEVKNASTRNWLCDQGMVNRALARIRELEYAVPYNSPELGPIESSRSASRRRAPTARRNTRKPERAMRSSGGSMPSWSISSIARCRAGDSPPRQVGAGGSDARRWEVAQS